jgi:UTP--glucose-1-phosphate uridylyltransferase
MPTPAPGTPAFFLRALEHLRGGRLAPGAPPPPKSLEILSQIPSAPRPGSSAHARSLALGERALREGQVARVLLAGGAATRFGGGAKATVPVLGEHTFLDLALLDAQQAAQRFGTQVPVAAMTSDAPVGPGPEDANHLVIERYLAQRWRGADVHLFRQAMLPRLVKTDTGWELYQGVASAAPGGHGDFFRAFRETGVGELLRRRGIRHVLFSNVDNAAATLDPVLLGYHIDQGQPMTMEFTPRRSPGGVLDKGGAPVRVEGRLQLLEQVDPEQSPFINTNNIWFDVEALLARALELPVQVVKKEVEGQTVYQVEQITADAPSVLDAEGRQVFPMAVVEVPRHDPTESRFEPVKEREDLPRVGARLAQRLGGFERKPR